MDQWWSDNMVRENVPVCNSINSSSQMRNPQLRWCKEGIPQENLNSCHFVRSMNSVRLIKSNFAHAVISWKSHWSCDVLFGQLLFTSSVPLTPTGPLGTQCPPSSPPPLSLCHTQTDTQRKRERVYNGKIVLIYPASSINRIISNNCHRQLGSQACDFILIDFLTCTQLRMIWFPSDTMFIKGILHKGINRYCFLDLYELWGKAGTNPLF